MKNPKEAFKFTLIFLILVAVQLSKINADNADYKDDIALTLKCLQEVRTTRESYSGTDLMASVGRFSTWHEEEEIPCFTRCLLYGKGYFDIEQNKWENERIVHEVGADVYNYCRFELRRKGKNGCEYAHRGLRCLQQAEENLNHTQTQLLICVNSLGISMEDLQRYGDFKQVEGIPCLFKCFAERMNFYTADYEWQYDNWIRAFGPVQHDFGTAYTTCKANSDKIKNSLNHCIWMYDEYLCVESLNYNTSDSTKRLTFTTTLSNVIEEESATRATAEIAKSTDKSTVENVLGT